MPTEKRVPSLIVNTLTETQYQALENPSDTEMWVTPYDESILPDQTGQSGKYLTTNGSNASWATVDTLPSQSGQSGKFLTTDGTAASWATISALQNTATGTNSLTILGTASTNSRATNIGATSVAVSQGTSIGYGARAHDYSVAVGDNAYSYAEYATVIGQSATCTARASVAIGANSKTQSGQQNVAIGADSETTNNVNNGTAIGFSAKSKASGATAIGYNAIAENSYSIQLGYGTNSTANTLSVGLSSSNNYQLLDSTGKIPAARMSLAAGLGMPALNGNNWVELTPGADGATYIMPEDGIVCYGANGGTIGGYIGLTCGNCANLHLASQAYEILRTFIFVPKGYTFRINYANAGTLSFFGYYKLIGNAN